MGANVADFSVIHLGSFTVDVDGLDSVRMNFQFRDVFYEISTG